MARERANLTQTSAAEALGLRNQAKSTISGWESGAREPRLRYLKAMAELYDVDLSLFTDPPPTAYESIDDRLEELARRALRLEREDWEAAERAREGAGEQGEPPRRRSA